MIKKIQINNTHAAVILDSGKLMLHPIKNAQQEKIFPENENDKNIVNFVLTNNFLILVDSSYRLRYYNVFDHNYILDFKKDI